MPKHLLWALVLLGGLGADALAFAFDPFTAMAVAGTAANAISAVSEAAGEVAATADAFGELYGEIDSDAAISDDGNKLVQDIQEVESLAHEAGYTREELDQLTKDAGNSEDAKKLSSTLRSITKAVRAGKRVSRLLMKLDQKAKVSQVESAQIEREQLVVMYRQLRAEKDKELREIKEGLRELKDKREQVKILKEEEKKSGAKQFGPTGVLSFPKQDSVVEDAIRIALGIRPALLQLLLFVFLARTVAYQFSFFGPARYGDLIRDAVVCAVLLMVFPDLIRASVSFCNEIAARVSMKDLQEVQPGKLDFPVEIGLSVKSRLLVEWLFQWIKYFAFVTTRFLANFDLAFMILLFPIVIFSSQMLNFAVAWPLFLGGFFSICLWPLFWNATGSLAALLWHKQEASLSDQIATILFSILQFLSPLVGIACLKGQPVSKAIQAAAGTVSSALSGGATQVVSQAKGLVTGSVGTQGGGKLGRVISYPVNQLASRSQAAQSRVQAARASGVVDPSTGAVMKGRTSGAFVREAARGFVLNSAAGAGTANSGKWGVVRELSAGLKRKNVLAQANESRSGKVEQRG